MKGALEVLALLAFIALAASFPRAREAPLPPTPSPTPAPLGTIQIREDLPSPYSISGVRPGQSLAQVERKLGRLVPVRRQVFRSADRKVSVFADAGVVKSVFGRSLEREGELIPGSPEEVEKTLGPPLAAVSNSGHRAGITERRYEHNLTAISRPRGTSFRLDRPR